MKSRSHSAGAAAVCTLLLAYMTAAPALGQSHETPTSDHLRPAILSLLVWIAEKAPADYRIPSDPPRIEYRTAEELRMMLFCEDGRTCDPKSLPAVNVNELFDFETGVMFIRDTLDPRDPEQLGTILVGLVHFVQHANGRSPKKICMGMLVREANGLQDGWRKDHGLPERPMDPYRMAAEYCGPGPT